MTEWEQIKKEYSELPVPAEGPQQVLAAMAKAKQKRSRIRQVTRYAPVAAAVLLVLLLPAGMLFSGGFGRTMNDAAMEADCVIQGTGGTYDQESAVSEKKHTFGFSATEKFYDDTATNEETAESAKDSSNSTMTDSLEGFAEEIVLGDESGATLEAPTASGFSQEVQEDISREVLRQMAEQTQKNGAVYYSQSEEDTEGAALFDKKSYCYINGEGLLVLVYEAGVLAPAEQGTVEFIIPAKVYQP